MVNRPFLQAPSQWGDDRQQARSSLKGKEEKKKTGNNALSGSAIKADNMAASVWEKLCKRGGGGGGNLHLVKI